jgi:hypothetical protein
MEHSSTKFIAINYCKIKPPKSEAFHHHEEEALEKKSSIQHIQCFHPIYSLFFDMNESNYNSISLNHSYHFHSLKQVLNISTKKLVSKNVHVKYSPLLDPIRYMIGKYTSESEMICNLPKLYAATEYQSHPKLLSIYNASYTDNFFNYLSSQLLNIHGFANGLDYYGSFLGIQDKFKINLTDDLDYLHDSTYFNRHVGELFTVDPVSHEGEIDITEEEENPPSRNSRPRLILNDAISLEMDDIIELESGSISKSPTLGLDSNTELESMIADVRIDNSLNSVKIYTQSTNSSSNSLVNYSSDEDDNVDIEDDGEKGPIVEYEISDIDDNSNDQYVSDSNSSYSEEEEEDEIYGYIKQFPVQMICLEKCDGTMDELFELGEMNPKTGASALMQIVMTLLVYQKAFHFTHNDLHTNNIMYVNTKIKYLYYVFEKQWYKVPTYGKIFKIIDFGRSIYQFQGHQFCSDSFATGGDAATQYNIEPFLDENKPRLDPNYSFDLCRLGCSIYDFIINDETVDEMDEFQRIIYRWCTDDNGKNMLYMKNGKERYPNFKLYKMIARTVHRHTPREQLSLPFFRKFHLSSSPNNKDLKQSIVVNLDEIPCYVAK